MRKRKDVPEDPISILFFLLFNAFCKVIVSSESDKLSILNLSLQSDFMINNRLEMLLEEGKSISQVVGYENGHLKIAILSIEDGHKLELIQYVYPSGSECIESERNALGSTHLAFNVENIDETWRELVGKGAVKLNPPVAVAPGKVVCYMRDPDGNWIELMEYSE